MHPGSCERRNTKGPFGRPADLERHLRNVHADPDQKLKFPCDYEKCSNGRHSEPFTRKDHYRDHLRDFHKEDIGAFKGEKAAKTSAEKKKWAKEQSKWLSERNIYREHWRCARCLVKKIVAKDGWECKGCRIPCEQERIDARDKLPPPTKHFKSVDMSYSHVEDTFHYQNFPSRICTDGYVDGGYGDWVKCTGCLACAAEQVQDGSYCWS